LLLFPAEKYQSSLTSIRHLDARRRMPSGDGYHVIMAILLLLHEAPKNEPAHQHDRSKRFLEPLGWAARERGAAQ
jgi:hypothetical protein